MPYMGHNRYFLNLSTIISILGIGVMGFFLFSPNANATGNTQSYTTVNATDTWSATDVKNLKNDIDAKYTSCSIPLYNWTLSTGKNFVSGSNPEVAAGKIIRAEHIYKLQNAILD